MVLFYQSTINQSPIVATLYDYYLMLMMVVVVDIVVSTNGDATPKESQPRVDVSTDPQTSR
jgi:hypothetical protein